MFHSKFPFVFGPCGFIGFGRSSVEEGARREVLQLLWGIRTDRDYRLVRWTVGRVAVRMATTITYRLLCDTMYLIALVASYCPLMTGPAIEEILNGGHDRRGD